MSCVVFTDIKVKKSRKKHRCDWCGEVINKGEKAQYMAGVYGGDFFCGYQHPECDRAMKNSDFECGDGFYRGEQVRGEILEEL